VNDRNGRVAILTAPRTIEIREEAMRPPADGAIIVRIRAALTDGPISKPIAAVIR
jgi:hypothetical protein